MRHLYVTSLGQCGISRMSQATLSERPYVNSNLFSGHYLDERVQERDEWNCDEVALEAMDELQSLYELEGPLVEGYGEDALIDNWIDEVLDILGFGTQEEVTLPGGGGFVDELLFEDTATRRDAAGVFLRSEDTTDLFERGIGIVEAKQWDAAFNVQFSEQRPYRNASHQTKHYLEHTPSNIQWGILTNGRKWRLYGTNDYETQTYYEVDLPELLERGDLEVFKYFFVFFRPAAFHESGGTTFLDEVWSESETASQELGENLQDNVFTALRVLGRGFVETNDELDIDPDDEAALDELKEQSLVFLYRLMFVLYAEARGLIHPEDQRAQDDYEENFSLDALRLEIHEEIGEVDEGFEDEFSEYSTSMWGRLEDLFRLIDHGEENLGIPPYNGGLFDHEEHEFLTEHEVSNRYLAEVIYRLSTTQNDEGRYVLADYADLDTRHLGSVYEGLLEHQFRIASEQYVAVTEDGGQVWKPATEVSVAEAVETVPEDGLYVVNDEGERKATGAYYTPDYVVTYIVEETVGPLVEEIREDLVRQGFEPGTQEYIGPFFRRVTDLQIVDPAMGSGHFLTKATGYLSEQVMAEVREAETEFGVAFDEQHIRREIAKECIYGVDVNGMAVELAKLSMWLETLAADRPLAFLDHHFKQGNSLVGSDIEEIEELRSDGNDDEQQASLAEFGATREGTIERLMDIYSEFLSIENETVEDVREMKRKYAEIEQDKLRRRLVALATAHTAEKFGKDLPSGAYERMARALESDDDWQKLNDSDWFSSAQLLGEEKSYFHWKLEFPEVFFNSDGRSASDAGFDAVIGNPPWGKPNEIEKDFLKSEYPDIVQRLPDTFAYFSSKMIQLAGPTATYGAILPQSSLFQSEFSKFRTLLINNGLKKVVDLGEDVFPDAVVPSAIFIGAKGPASEELHVSNLRENPESLQHSEFGSTVFKVSDIHKNKNEIIPTYKIELNKILLKIRERTEEIGGQFNVEQGLQTGGDDEFTVTEPEIEEYGLETDYVHPVIFGSNVHPFYIDFSDDYVIYIPRQVSESSIPNILDYLSQYREKLSSTVEVRKEKRPWYSLKRARYPDLFEQEKVVLRQTSDTLISATDTNGFYCVDSIHCITRKEESSLNLEILNTLLNSSLLRQFYDSITQEKGRVFSQVNPENVKQLPLPDIEGNNGQCKGNEFLDMIEQGEFEPNELKSHIENQNSRELVESLPSIGSKRGDFTQDKEAINLSLMDYLGSYTTGPTLEQLGGYQPPKGIIDTILTGTKDDYENLRVGTVNCGRTNRETVIVNATARYKPENGDSYETDRWGYTETEPIPAMRLTDLSKIEADLIEVFVPLAVEEADGFAGFRETATKTNSLVDRLKAITLPDPDDVADDLERYNEAVQRAEELDEKIQRTDDLIDEIVYDLYGLTDEKIEIVEEAVNDD